MHTANISVIRVMSILATWGWGVGELAGSWVLIFYNASMRIDNNF